MERIKKAELKQWAREKMKGVENCTFPSFLPGLAELDEDGIRWDVNMAVKHGFFSTLAVTECGLSFEEAKKFLQIVTDEAKGKILVSTTLLFDSFEKNWEMLKYAEEVGCHLVLFGYPPSFYPKSEEEIYKITREMCDATNLGIVLYPSPQFNFERLHPSGFNPKLLARMAEFDNAVAIKVGEAGLAADCARLFGDKVLVSNPSERFLPMMHKAYGQQWIGAGCYEVYQSPQTRGLVNYFNLLMEGKEDEAMEIYWSLAIVRNMFEAQHMQTVMLGLYHWNMQKYYQWLVGGNGGYVRQPCMKLLQHDMEPFKFALSMIGIEPRQPDEEFYIGRVNYAKLRGVSPEE